MTLARLDIRYTAQLGETKHPLYTYKNLWGYAKELWEIPAFKNNTFFADFAVPPADAKGSVHSSGVMWTIVLLYRVIRSTN